MLLKNGRTRSTWNLLVWVSLALSIHQLQALDFTFRTEGDYSTESANALFVEESFAFAHMEGPFSLTWELLMENSGYYPEPFLADFYGDFTVDIENAGVQYHSGAIEAYAGKLPIKDEIDSPYSLFINGSNPSVMTGGYKYASGGFSFSNRWIGLDRNTDTGLYRTTEPGILRDRGAVLKTYAYQMGNLRLGFQDATIFTGTYFDIDVFANPAPSFFVQYVLSAAGRPNSRSGDQNSIMGFFGDYQGQGWSVYAQVLVDDFNANRFINPSSYQNPDKIAWSIGGRVDLPYGRLGLYTAGATKYTFESVEEEFYSYTLHAGSAIYSGGQIVSVPLESQMLGYINGENNVAAKAIWTAPAMSATNFEAGLECVVSGSKSPTNPWHNGEAWALLGTQLLNDPVLEIKVLLTARVSREIGDFTLFAQGAAGYVFNRLNPVYSARTISGFTMYEPVYIPNAGDSSPIAMLGIGGQWTLRL